MDIGPVESNDAAVSKGPQQSAVESLKEAGRLLGGATSFTDNYRTSEAVRVFPKTGSVLIFQQRNLMHSGDDVFRGVKFTVRTDVMYTSES